MSLRLRAGKMDRRVKIQEATVTGQDTYNQDVTTWTDMATVWAEVVDLSGRTLFAVQQTNSRVSTRVRIWYHAGVRANIKRMRILDGARVLPLVSPPVDPDGRKRELHLMCEEIAGNGQAEACDWIGVKAAIDE